MKLTDRKWKEFKIGELFNIKIGINIDGNKINKESGNIPYITRKENNNGLDGFIEYSSTYLNKLFPVITIGNETAKPFVQAFPFFTGTKVNIMSPLQNIGLNILLFICTCLEQHKNKYSYSYTVNSTRLKKQAILLPVNSQNQPDFEFMEKYIRELMYKKRLEYINYATTQLEEIRKEGRKEGRNALIPLQSQKWKEFKIAELFNVFTGRDVIMNKTKKGLFPIVSHSVQNNGIAQFISTIPNRRLFTEAPTITLADRGNFYATVQPFSCYIATRVKALKNKQILSKETLFFISNQINQQAVKFNYGHNACDNINSLKIMLPVDNNYRPDFNYMAQYIKNIFEQKYVDYLHYVQIH